MENLLCLKVDIYLYTNRYRNKYIFRHKYNFCYVKTIYSFSRCVWKPLVEKYRPKTFDDIIFNKFLAKKFSTMLKHNIIQDMILTGEPSTGKTSTALFLGSKIFDSNNIFILHASDDRKIKCYN